MISMFHFFISQLFSIPVDWDATVSALTEQIGFIWTHELSSQLMKLEDVYQKKKKKKPV